MKCRVMRRSRGRFVKWQQKQSQKEETKMDKVETSEK